MSIVGPKSVDYRNLNKRSGLEFWFPDINKNFNIFSLPFFENPIIKENKKANYVKYNPLSRSSALHAYTGAASRTFKVDFTFTLLHLLQHNMGYEMFAKLISGKQGEKRRFFPRDARTVRGKIDVLEEEEKKFFDLVEDVFGVEQDGSDPFRGRGRAGVSTQALFDALRETTESKRPELHRLTGYHPHNDQKRKALDTLLYFITLCRLSVVNNASNPSLGPPIIRLNFGAMFNSIPCICETYDISYDELAGYDLMTITPLRFKISLNLTENRAGDFQEFEPGQIVQRDNLAGWEILLSPETTIPNIDSLSTGIVGGERYGQIQ